MMNVTLPEKEKWSRKRVIVYLLAISICVIAIVIAVSIQVLGDEVTNHVFGVGKLLTKTEEEEQTLKSNFDQIFQNNIQTNGYDYTGAKIEQDKDVIYTRYEKQETQEGDYQLDVHIPFINLDQTVIHKYNSDIQQVFEEKVKSTLASKNQNVIYQVQYQASIENNILSVIIRSNLKQGTSPQRVIVQTYHFDLENNREISLEEVVAKVGLNRETVQIKIRDDIKKEQKKAQDLKELGYEIYERDSQSDVYNIENSTEFFMFQGNLYVIYAYGNQHLTTELDLVVF